MFLPFTLKIEPVSFLPWADLLSVYTSRILDRVVILAKARFEVKFYFQYPLLIARIDVVVLVYRYINL